MSSISSTLESLGIRPSKRLGQNFLVQPSAAKKIALFSKPSDRSAVLEIGPGLGALTEELGKLFESVVAVEKDRRLYAHLAAKHKDASWLQLIHADILDLDLSDVLSDGPWAVVANLPYSQATPILDKLIQAQRNFTLLSFLLQNEMVQRMAASVGTKNYGRLSVFVQSQFHVEEGPKISRDCFFPKPDVDSRLIRLTPKSETLWKNAAQRKALFELVALLFSYRRKTIRNALRVGHFSPNDLQRLEGLGIDLSRRPETLQLKEFQLLTKAWKEF